MSGWNVRIHAPWLAPLSLLVLSYFVAVSGPFSFALVPVLAIGLALGIARRAWFTSLALLVLNPLMLYFAGGLVDYSKGAPHLRSNGLPRQGFFNVDRETRCFRTTGGCLVQGDEWVMNAPHNAALRLASAIMGPPSRGYDGPYPDKADALKLVSSAPLLRLEDLALGKIRAENVELQADPDMLGKIMWDSGVILSLDEGPDDVRIQAVLVENRCLILRFVQPDRFASTTEARENEFLVLMDCRNMRPFASYRINGRHGMRIPSVKYLP